MPRKADPIMRVGDQNAERQQELYNLLLARGDEWSSMEFCTDSIKLYPAFFTTNYHNSRARRMLTADIEYINNSDKFEKIIVSTSRGVKLASEKDFEKFLSAELREVFGKLKRLRKLAKKGTRDQQINLEGEIADAFLGGDNG